MSHNIVFKLTHPFRKELKGVSRVRWKELRVVFCHFVDKDESLQKQSQIIRFNGLLWTSVADLRVVSIVGILLFSLSMICSRHLNNLAYDEVRADFPIFALTILFLMSFPASRKLKENHKQIGEQQCDYIVYNYNGELKNKLENIIAELEYGQNDHTS